MDENIESLFLKKVNLFTAEEALEGSSDAHSSERSQYRGGSRRGPGYVLELHPH